MDNFSIKFAYPWLLLLLIAAVILTLIPYFRLKKRYRRTRNRITSIVLRMIVLALTTSVLAGMTMHYTIPNEKNEIILLVDVSDTEELAAEKRDEFVQTVLNDGQYDEFNIAIVTFGFDQVRAADFSRDVDALFQKYLEAPKPDTSATNIAGAISYAKTLFDNPETGKIVLITDGKETDEKANDAIYAVVSQGTKLDVAYIPSKYTEDDAQVIDIALPDYHIVPDEPCAITVTVQTNVECYLVAGLKDNGEASDAGLLYEKVGAGQTHSFTFMHTFNGEGLHELSATVETRMPSGNILEIDPTLNTLDKNDVYATYVNVERFNNVLIIQRAENESDELIALLQAKPLEDGSDPYVITLVTIGEEKMPSTVDAFRAYDQVILNNISNADLRKHDEELKTEGLPDNEKESVIAANLEAYVNEFGGALLTVGGNDEHGDANAYKRSDMYGTTYQQMLPVQAINYTPPIGIIVVIDQSGSMSEADTKGDLYIEGAKLGALACLDALDEKDYMGVMTLSSDYGLILPATPAARRADIIRAINSVTDAGGGTEYTSAIIKAGEELRKIKSYVSKLHVIIVSDGLPGDDPTDYHKAIKDNYDSDGITFSLVGVGIVKGSDTAIQMEAAVDAVGVDDPDKKGRLYIAADSSELVTAIKTDLGAPAIAEINEGEFMPTIANPLSSIVYGLERGEGADGNKLKVTLNGFYGARARASADLILTGEFEVPIYAQWKYGNGMVGSFMCDLQASTWSSDFMASETGSEFIRKAVNNLMPVNSIRPNPIRVKLEEDNYTNTLSVITDVDKAAGETLEATILKKGADEQSAISLNKIGVLDSDAKVYVKSALSAENDYSKCTLIIKEGGVYILTFTKKDKDGKVLATNTVYKAFSYSEEYDIFHGETDVSPEDAMEALAAKGEGVLIEDLENPWEIFDGFVTDIEKSFDPRFAFMIAAIILFLLDIAVRKFKFKWPHEIIRDYKRKKFDK